MRYQIDDNIELLANKILKETKKLSPDYLRIESLATGIIKYCKRGLKYDYGHMEPVWKEKEHENADN